MVLFDHSLVVVSSSHSLVDVQVVILFLVMMYHQQHFLVLDHVVVDALLSVRVYSLCEERRRRRSEERRSEERRSEERNYCGVVVVGEDVVVVAV